MGWTIAEGKQHFSDVVRRVARPLAKALAELGRICEEDGYTLKVPERVDRVNPLLAEPKRASRRQPALTERGTRLADGLDEDDDATGPASA